MADITTKYKSKWTGAEIDDGIEKARNAVPLDGSKAMTGDLHIYAGATGASFYADRDYNGTKYSANLGLFPEGTPYLGRRKNGTLQSYILLEADKLRFNSETAGIYSTVLHTGNKPSGSYTGNGSSAYRSVALGGIGRLCLITRGGNYWALVCARGCIISDGSSVTAANNVIFDGDNNLQLNTSHAALNENGVNYSYQVL